MHKNAWSPNMVHSDGYMFTNTDSILKRNTLKNVYIDSQTLFIKI